MVTVLIALQRLVAWLRARLYRIFEPRPRIHTSSPRTADADDIRADVDWALRQPVCACLIVKNEAKVIERCLASVRPHVTHWAIVDTGSTDGTQDIIRRAMADMPGELIEREWVDFSTNRNQSLELGRKVLGVTPACGKPKKEAAQRLSSCDRSSPPWRNAYLFVIDADEELVAPDGVTFPAELTRDAYAMRLRMDDHDGSWVRRVLVRADQPWHYVFEIHECLCLPEGYDMVPPRVLQIEVQSHNDSARNQAGRDKYLRDAAVLKGMLEREPDNPRHWYYLGQALAGALEIDAAIAAFRQRVSLGGWPEEQFYAAYMIAALHDYKACGDKADDEGNRGVRCEADRHRIVGLYLDAYALRPTRAEPLWAAAVVCNDSGVPAQAEMFARKACSLRKPSDALMVHEPVYEWRALDELIGALARMGRQEEALRYLEKLRDSPLLPPGEYERFDKNAAQLRADLLPANLNAAPMAA